jgi:hypothetical protein
LAKFTATVPLNIKWAEHAFVGTPSTTYRVTDALVEEFVEEVVPGIPGFAWVTQDELTSIVTLPIAQTDVTGLTAALAAKYDKAGGIISGAASVTGAFVAQAAATVAGTLIAQSSATVAGSLAVQNNLNVTNSITGADISLTGAANIGGAATVTGTLTAKAAANMSSTLGVTGKLTLGNVVAMGGTAFPGSPADNDLYYRTDLDLLFFYNGTRWLSAEIFSTDLGAIKDGAPYAASQTFACVQAASLHGGSDLFVLRIDAGFAVNSGGTALSASHKWVLDILATRDGTTTNDTVGSISIDSGASGVWRTLAATVNALLNNGTTHVVLRLDLTKTGTPGTLLPSARVLYRVVAT